MTQSVEQILNDELGSLKASVMKQYEQSGHMASGSTHAAFESYLQSPTHAILEGASHLDVLQNGRGPGKLPAGFNDILRRWVQAKGISFKTEADMNRFIYFVSKKISEEGTKLYKSGQTIDILETPVSDFQTKLTRRLTNYYTATLKNQIFRS